MNGGEFRAMLLTISNALEQDSLESLKFLCKVDVGKKKLEKIKSGIDLFECLIERGQIKHDDTVRLRSLLENVGKTVLIEHIDNYERGSTAIADLLDEKEQEKINIATEVIVEQLGRNWKKFGRKLGLKDPKLDSIQDKHKCDQEEQLREVVKEWMKIKREEARVEMIVNALRDCRQNYTADLVVNKLLSVGH
ncbi:FAS-associated death domain protein FAS-associating death domain-containing protein [Triplophysa tibetana]|uniref:FAS-associated death domain protein FAS-associating death domain-containing protein n=1 Tax=Triplophysa tibetana TaxID=1572043 RepID=A0A5A9PPG5_9TELE|nr:FAS-associated death domain protein FAS-associating death domain-containing protein [Triplophysa tibetana]